MKDKIVFVTGASSGIGQACAKIFAQHGAKLILCARRKDRIDALAEELKKNFNTESFVFTLDVRIREKVQQAINTLPEEWSAIDILINNAGLARGLKKMYEGDIDERTGIAG